MIDNTEEKMSRCVELYSSGMTIRVIAKEIGCYRGTVRRWLRKAGVRNVKADDMKITKQFTEYERGYIEALIDGEGCLCGYNRKDGEGKYSYRLIISNNCIEIINKAKEILGCGSIVVKHDKRHPSINYELRINSNGLRNALPQITFLTPKKEKLRLEIIEYLNEIDNRNHQRNECRGTKAVKMGSP